MKAIERTRYKALKLVEAGQHSEAVSVLAELAKSSEHSGDYAWRAQSLVAIGRYREALADCETAMQADATDPSSFVTAAFVHAAAPDDDLRDGTRALQLLSHASKLIGLHLNWRILTVFAAARAECGEFKKAEQFLNDAISKAPPEMTSRLSERIVQYRNGVAFRATLESNIGSLEIREHACVLCGQPAFMKWPPQGGNRKPRCVDCCSHDTS